MKRSSKNISQGISRARLRVGFGNFVQAFVLLVPALFAFAVVFALLGQFRATSALAALLPFVAVAVLFALFLVILTRSLSTRRLAEMIDKGAGLEDRITSALEFLGKDRPTVFMEAAVADAEAKIAGVDFKSVFSLRPKNTRRPIMLTLFLIPILACCLFVDIGSRIERDHTALNRDLPVDQIPEDVPEAPALAKVEGPPQLAPLISPVKDYIDKWRKQLAQFKKQMEQHQQKLEQEVPKAIFADSATRKENSVMAGIRKLKTAITDNRVHLADLATMGVTDTSEYKDAFAALDDISFDEEPNIAAVQALADSMQKAADKKAQSSKMLTIGAAMAAQMGTDSDEVGAFKNATQGAMQQSFNEFMRNYAEHLGNIVETKKELVQKARREGKIQKIAMSSAPPPPDAKLKMHKIGKEDFKKLQLAPNSFREQKLTDEMAKKAMPNTEGSSKAGRGGGTAEGSIKVQQIAQSSQYVELQGQMGEGKSPIQIIEDLNSINSEDFTNDQYRLIYVDYTEGASTILDGETIPVEIKSYVRDYFLSINPDKLQNSSAKEPAEKLEKPTDTSEPKVPKVPTAPTPSPKL